MASVYRDNVGKVQKGTCKGESEGKKGQGTGRAKRPETCLWCKEGHKKADRSHNISTCSSCGKVGHLRAVCRNPIAHELSDERVPEAVVGKVWCVAVSDGRCDCPRHPTSVDEMELHRKLVQDKPRDQISKLIQHELRDQNKKIDKIDPGRANESKLKNWQISSR